MILPTFKMFPIGNILRFVHRLKTGLDESRKIGRILNARKYIVCLWPYIDGWVEKLKHKVLAQILVHHLGATLMHVLASQG